MAYSPRLLRALFALFLIVSSGVLVCGQVGSCTGTGCSCTETYTCCLMVREEEPIGSEVGSAEIGFNITGTNPEFEITTDGVPFVINDNNTDTGLITTTEVIDRESVESCIRLTVALSQTINSQVNSVLVPFAVEIVDINDNDPQFSQEEYTFSVDETQAGELMTELVCSGDLQATDEDDSTNGQVSYSVSGSNYFAVTNNGVPCILNTKELDRETDESLSFTLVATDGGGHSDSANVTMVLLDINDNAPMFEDSYVFHVREDREVNSILDPPILAFDADDGSNAEIRYEIQGPLPNDFQFQINSSSGVLTLISSLDYEDIAQDPVITFTVRATDMGNSPQDNETQVTIVVEDVNERAEMNIVTSPMNNRDSILEEDIREDPILSFTLIDRDSDANGNNTIVFLSGGEYFSFRSTSFTLGGELLRRFSIVQNVSIDREENREVRSTLELSFMLVEGGSPELTTNFNYTIDILDINDNSPELSETQFQIGENDEPFERIVALDSVAFDLDSGDNGSVESYRLVSVRSHGGNDLTDRFLDVNNDIFPTTGQLVAPEGLDREVDGPSLTIIVELSDGGEPPLSVNRTIIVDILDENDNVPVFESASYAFTLRENSNAGSTVGSVSATDDDEGENAVVVYSLAEPSEDFKITDSGQIISLRPLDREMTDSFTIHVIANNPTPFIAPDLSSEVSVTITIEDENDNPPLFVNSEFTFSVSSDARIGTTVGQLQATDADIGENGEVHYRLDISRFFEINDQSGVITTMRTLNGPETINLTVTANNPTEVTPSQQSQVEITIFVLESDANSNMALISGSLAGVITIIIVAVIAVVTVLLCWRGKRIGKLRFHSTNPDALNNGRPPSPKSILRHVPSMQQHRGMNRGVTFGGTVKKTVYDDSETVASDPSVYQVNSTINFGSSDESPITPPRSHINGSIPSEGLPLSNGVLCGQRTRQRSPLVMEEDLRLSEGSAYNDPDHYPPFDGPSNSDEESTLSDASSTKNTSIPRFRSPEERIANHNPQMHYSSPHTHPPLPPYQHYHTPTPPHLPHPHGLLPHPINYSQHHSGSLTLTPAHSPHSTLVQHSSTSPQIPHMGTPPAMLHSNGRSRPIVMPDAYPHGTPGGRRFESSYTGFSFVSDYETSTCASAELDEQLHFMPDSEPRFISLSTTDVYSYDDDTQL